MKKKIAFLTILTIATFITPTIASENRAKLQTVTADLLLPDDSQMTVDMNFDCQSEYHDTAMIVTSDYGAELLAAAYAAKWGEHAGKQIIEQWYTKADPNDPRLPTFIIVTLPSDDRTKTTKAVEPMPIAISSCGTIQHDPDGNN